MKSSSVMFFSAFDCRSALRASISLSIRVSSRFHSVISAESACNALSLSNMRLSVWRALACEEYYPNEMEDRIELKACNAHQCRHPATVALFQNVRLPIEGVLARFPCP